MTITTTNEINSNSVEGGQSVSTTVAPIEAERKVPETAATRGDAKSQDRQQFGTKAVGALLLIPVLLFVIVLAGHRSHPVVPARKPQGITGSGQQTQPENTSTHSATPLMNLDGHNAQAGAEDGISPEEMARTAHHDDQEKIQTGSGNTPGTLGGVADFNQADWQPQAFQAGATDDPSAGSSNSERSDVLDKPSLVFVRSANSSAEGLGNADRAPEIGLGLPTGTRLRAHLEAVATTAVNIPVIAVIDYNYERNGDIMIPAGAKALGRVEQADRTGYLSIQFDSLLMPDGTTLPIRGVATDLSLRPLKGKVEGTHSRKNIVVRTLTGIGQTGAVLMGGNPNQSVSEADLMRTQAANNIGQVSDEEIAKTSVTERVVVSVPAQTRIYVILEKSSSDGQRANGTGSEITKSGNQANIDELKELLELQRAMTQAPAAQP